MRSTGQRSSTDYHGRFQQLESRFIDEPREAVAEAEALVRQAVDEMLARLRSRIDRVHGANGDTGDAPDTEHLRIAMREYRDVLTSLEQPGAEGRVDGARERRMAEGRTGEGREWRAAADKLDDGREQPPR